MTLNNPKVNALSRALLAELRETAESMITDPPGAIVITGGERIFAAGADISEFGDAEQAHHITAGSHAALNAVAKIPRFVIAAVSGYALGGGCELALACDYRIAGERAAAALACRSEPSQIDLAEARAAFARMMADEPPATTGAVS